MILILFVLNNLIRNRLTAKSNEFKSDLFNGCHIGLEVWVDIYQ